MNSWSLKETVGPFAAAEVVVDIAALPIGGAMGRAVSLRVREPQGTASVIYLSVDDVDNLVRALRAMQAELAEKPSSRPVASIDLAIPEQLADVFSFIGGRSDGKLFVLLPRPAAIQLRWESGRGVDTSLTSIPIAIPANALITLDLKDPR